MKDKTILIMGVTYNLDDPIQYTQALIAAQGLKNEARQFFENTRRYLMRTTRLLNKIKAYQVTQTEKEVCHER